jgi:hypothetical protein
VQLDGSPLDAAVFGLLSAAAVGVLIRRGERSRTLLAANWPILIYFFYCLISVAWSYHPDVSFKRWIKGIGDVAMVLVVVTDGQPVAAFRRLISRIGFLLFPVFSAIDQILRGSRKGIRPERGDVEYRSIHKQEHTRSSSICRFAGHTVALSDSPAC